MLIKRLSLSKIGDLLKDRLGEQAEDYVFPEDFEKAVVDIGFKAIVLEGQTRPYDAIVIGDALADYRLTYENSTTANVIKSIQFIGNPTGISQNNICGNPNLTSINLPSSLTSLNASALYGNTGLTSIDLSNVLSIGGSCFSGCTGLTYVLLNPYATIGNDAFANCTGLITMGEEGGGYNIELVNNGGTAVPYIKTAKVQTVVVPNGYTNILGFYQCLNLTSITIPDSVTTLGQSCFSMCSGLTSLVSNGATYIPSDCCNGCTSLRTASFPSAATMNGQTPFKNCAALETLQLGSVGNSCTINRTDCFTGCTNPSTVVTCYCDETNLATNLTRIRTGVTRGTIIMKAAADMVYNNVSYSAGDTVVTSTV